MTSTILVVDDQSDARRLVRMVMELERHQIIEAANGESALAMAHLHRPDCVIIDLRMPGRVDGFNLCQAIKNDPDLSQIPVIILSAFFQQDEKNLGIEFGADAFLEKPFNFSQLLDEVDRVIDRVKQ
ncbi:response regulator [Undibacterium sp. RuRC25W]|uniref:response regulator n=1 Tax=Undibacterium sp. RuRC25W TaxID=3413047 RepID=UPI003BF37DFD